MTGYATGPDNQLTTDGTWNYKYDNAGNVIEKDGAAGGSMAGYTWKYAFDNANRLTVATEYNGSTAVVQELNFYAVNGNRVEQDVTQSGTTTVTKFAYDLSGNVIADLNSTNGVVTRRMFLDARDSLFARIASGGTVDFYLADHLGSIRGLENTSGTLDDAITFDAWGNKASESNPANGDRYGYTGREWDAVLSLQYNPARYYDPAIGRWLSQDPLAFAAGDSNLSRYVHNDPIGSTDPSGMQALQLQNNWRPFKPAVFNWVEAKTVTTLAYTLLQGPQAVPGTASEKSQYDIKTTTEHYYYKFQQMWKIDPTFFATKVQQIQKLLQGAADLAARGNTDQLFGTSLMVMSIAALALRKSHTDPISLATTLWAVTMFSLGAYAWFTGKQHIADASQMRKDANAMIDMLKTAQGAPKMIGWVQQAGAPKVRKDVQESQRWLYFPVGGAFPNGHTITAPHDLRDGGGGFGGGQGFIPEDLMKQLPTWK
jgi:RHS repeat-associated protein